MTGLPRHKGLLLSYPGIPAAISAFCVVIALLSRVTPGICGVGDWTTFTFANDVRDIAFDRGRLWLATTGGAVRYDPVSGRFTIMTNTDGLGGNNLSSVVVDRNGDVWFGTQGHGLSRFRRDTGTWRTFTALDGLAGERVGDLTIQGDNLWIATDDGLSVFIWAHEADEGRDTFTFSDAYRASRGVPVGALNAVAVSATTIWAGTDNGVAAAPLDAVNLKDPNIWTTYTVFDGLPDNRVTALAISEAGVWAGTARGVARFDGTRWVTMNTGLPVLEIRGLAFIDGTLWAATVSETARFDGAAWTPVGGGVGPGGARTVTGDSTGTVWMGAARNGLGRLEQGTWRFFPSSGPAGNVVDALFVDRNGDVWYGFDEGDVSRFDGRTWRTFTPADGLAPGPVSMVGEDRTGRRWFGTFGNGVSSLEDQGTDDKADDRWETLDQTNSVFEGILEDPNFVVVNAWALDADGGQWFSNFGIGAQFLSPDGTWTTFRPRAGALSSNRIRGIAVAADGSVWFATDDRLSRYFPDQGRWRVYGIAEGLLSPQVNAVTASNTGDVWVGTDAGVDRFQGGEAITSLALPVGLNTAAVTALATDARGNLWAGARTGLGLFMPEAFEWRVFTPENSPLADPLIKSIAVDRSTGTVWVGTGGGISRFESGILPVRSTLSDILVYPNPFIPSRGDAGIVFGRLADGARVSILTVAGELVRQIPPEEIVAQQAQWDGKNDVGKPVAGGIYFFVVTAPDGSDRSGKIAVIR